jgi:hypothetical protein
MMTEPPKIRSRRLIAELRFKQRKIVPYSRIEQMESRRMEVFLRRIQDYVKYAGGRVPSNRIAEHVLMLCDEALKK